MDGGRLCRRRCPRKQCMKIDRARWTAMTPAEQEEAQKLLGAYAAAVKVNPLIRLRAARQAGRLSCIGRSHQGDLCGQPLRQDHGCGCRCPDPVRRRERSAGALAGLQEVGRPVLLPVRGPGLHGHDGGGRLREGQGVGSEDSVARWLVEQRLQQAEPNSAVYEWLVVAIHDVTSRS